MKRKLLMTTLMLTLAVCSILGLTACGHEHSYTTSVVAPTCTEKGYTTYTCSCGDSYVDDYVVALGHNFGTPTYSWDNDKCIAIRECGRDSSHKETESVTAKYVKDTDATCTEPEKGHYVATFVNNAFSTQTTATNSVENGNIKGHSFINYVYNNDATCIKDGTETATCSRNNCSAKSTREKTNTKLGHNFGTPTYSWDNDKCIAIRECGRDSSHKETESVTAKYVKDTDATCTTAEKGHYVATFNNDAFATQRTTTNSILNGTVMPHPTDNKWNYTETHHWFNSTCSCNIKLNFEEHTIDDIGYCTICKELISSTKGVVYEKSEDGTYAVVTGYIGTSKKVIVADEFEGLPVEEVAKGAFSNLSITSLVIPDSVIVISGGAIIKCNKLEEISLPFVGCGYDYCDGFYGGEHDSGTVFGAIFESVTTRKDEVIEGAICQYIKLNLFGVSGLNQYYYYYIPSTLISVTITGGKGDLAIPTSSFVGCHNIKNIVLGDGVKYVKDRTFCDLKGLQNIEISSSVTHIGQAIVDNCLSLNSIIFNDDTTWYKTSGFYGWQTQEGGAKITLGSASENVTLLKDTYRDYYWYKI